MAHFNLEKQISEATKLNAPIQRGPLMRWQRKALETGVRSLSLDNLNVSSHSNISGPRSGQSGGKTPCGKNPSTPHSGRTPCSPSRLNINVDRLSNGRAKTPNKSATCKTPGKGKTPNKSGSNTPHHNQGDRFIPNRSAMDLESSHYMLVNSENVNPVDPTMSPASAEQQRKMATALRQGKSEDSKILSFKQKAPQAQEGYLNNLRVLYCGNQAASAQKPVASRQIPQQPERILDAPELLDDFYLNLLSWSANNHLAVALGQAVYLWNAGSGDITQLMELENPEEYVSSLSWIKEGNILGVGNSGGAVQLWDVSEQKMLRSMTGHAARVGSLAWNSYIISSGCRTGVIHQHDVRVPEHHVGTLASHTQEVCGLTWSPDGRFLASGANDNLCNVWDANLGHDIQPLHSFNQHMAAVKALAWCPWQGSLLASGGGTADRHIRFWNVSTGACVQSIDTNSQVSSLLWSREHKELISGHGFSQFQLTLWKYPQMTKVADLQGHQARILCLALSPDGSTVASAAADETLRLWKCWAVDKQTKPTAAKVSTKGKSSLLTKGIR